MWFKNLLLYRLTEPFTDTPEALGEALAAGAARPCAGLDPFTYGFSPPLGRLGSELVHAAGGRIALCATREERLLPPAVVREATEDRAAEIEAREGRTVRPRERRRIRDEIFFELLPRAFTRSIRTHAYLDPGQGWLVIDAASPRRAEELVILLGHCVDSLHLEPYAPPRPPTRLMTGWLAGKPLPEGFSLQHDCELRDPREEGAVVRCQRQDLASDEIRAHLEAGKEVHRLALGFEERLSLVLGTDLAIRRLRFEAVDELDDVDEADEVARFDANFAFMTTELGRLLTRLDEVLSRE